MMGAKYMVVMIATNIYLDEFQTRAVIIGIALLDFDDLCLYCHNEA